MRIALVILVLALLGAAVSDGDENQTLGESSAPTAIPEETFEDETIREDAVQPDPVTGAPIPAVGTEAREDMERKEIECFDSGRTDCADRPGAYLDDPLSYP